MKRWGSLLLVAAMFAGCDGCKKSERVSPLAFIERDADAVLEIQDIGALSKLPAYVEQHLGAVINKAQIDSLRQELELTIGFDPTTPEGLKKVGLPKSGAVAASVAADGSGALWLIPVEDPKLLMPVLTRQVKARSGADKEKTSKAGAVDVTTLSNEFGPEVVERAAYAVANGHVFLAFGKTATKRVTDALARKPNESVLEHPEYKALTATLGSTYHARVIAPSGAAAINDGIRLLGRYTPAVQGMSLPIEEQVRGAGWNLMLEPGAVRVKGRVRLTEQGLANAKKVFAPKAKVGPGVVSLDLPDTVIHAQVAVDPAALIAALAPAGSPAREKLDASFGRVKNDVNIDVEQELVPLMTGHGALALGVGNLEGKSFKELVGNPRGFLWTAFALGAEDAKALVAKEQQLDEGLKLRGLDVVPRKFNNIDLRSIRPKVGGAALVETFALPKAWIFANEPAVADRIILNGGGQDQLGGENGAVVELRLKTLADQVSTFDKNSLPLLWRGMVAKGLDLVKLFDRAEAKAVLAEDGLDVSGALVFSK